MSSALLNSNNIKAQALRLGFVACGLAKAEPVDESFAVRYQRWLDLDFCGEMDYMRRNVEMRLRPDLLVPGVKAIVSLAMNFMPENPQPAISLYAQGKDYHEVMKQRMQELMHAGSKAVVLSIQHLFLSVIGLGRAASVLSLRAALFLSLAMALPSSSENYS